MCRLRSQATGPPSRARAVTALRLRRWTRPVPRSPRTSVLGNHLGAALLAQPGRLRARLVTAARALVARHFARTIAGHPVVDHAADCACIWTMQARYQRASSDR